MSFRPAVFVASRYGLSLLVGFFIPPPSLAMPPDLGISTMLDPQATSLLASYFDRFLEDQDLEAFKINVMTRYSEGTLARISRSGGLKMRRAAILALGLVGSFASNESVARGLRDEDETVRGLAQNALWAIWFRADTPENNGSLQEVRDLISRERFRDAERLANELIIKAPAFAEAYNQKAIALFFQGRFEESAFECHRALARNPYHIGALGGLGQCYLRLDRKRDALHILRRALTIQPFDASLRQTVAAFEAEGN